jgi:hypothetical protein
MLLNQLHLGPVWTPRIEIVSMNRTLGIELAGIESSGN